MTSEQKNWPRRRNNLHAKWAVQATCTCPNFCQLRPRVSHSGVLSITRWFYIFFCQRKKNFGSEFKRTILCFPLFLRFSLIPPSNVYAMPARLRRMRRENLMKRGYLERERVSSQALLKMNWYENLTIKLEVAGRERRAKPFAKGKGKYWFESRPQLKVGTGGWRRDDYERWRWKINWRNWKFRPQPDKSKEIVSWLRPVITTLQWPG